jgi:hypothetical protein
MEKITKHPTYFVDIDGTLVVYRKFVDLEKSILLINHSKMGFTL